MGKNPEKKKFIGVKNILLILSLVPYAVFLVLGLINCITKSIESNSFDIFNILEPVVGFWEEAWLSGDVRYMLISIFAIVYPIYYLIDKAVRAENKLDRVGESENQPTEPAGKKKVSKLFILFLLSFLPYLLMGYFSALGMNFGLFSSSYMIYGFEALLLVLITCSVLPIYPVALIFQIIYLIKRYKTLTKKCKQITKCTIIGVIVVTLVPSLIYMAIDKIEIASNFKSDKIVIENYLKDEFGEEHFEDMEILENDAVYNSYSVKTPLLDDSFYVELSEDRTEVSGTSFYDIFSMVNHLNDKLSKRLTEQYGLPENVKIKTASLNYDISKYSNSSNVDDLLDDCEYKISSVYIYVDSYDKQEIVDIIKDYYLKCEFPLGEYNNESGEESQILDFYVLIDDDYYANVFVYKLSQQPDTLVLNFRGYTDSEGTTIEDSKVTVKLVEQ